MEVFVKIAQFILSLSIIVILHEMGHFGFAKLFKTRVEKFYLFFDPWFSLFKFRKGETEYGVGWLPLGGYVKISGMIDESMDKEQMKQPAQPWEFRAKPAWQRLLIMLGGVMVNFVLAIIIYVGALFIWGEDYLPTENAKYGVSVDSLGIEMGLQNGDKIVSVDNEEVENFLHIVPEILLNERKSIQVERDGERVDVILPDGIVKKLIKHQGGGFAPRFPFDPYEIDGFMKESPAKVAGIEKGDVLLAVDGRSFEWHDEFQSYVKEKGGNAEVDLLFKRGDDTLKLSLALTDKGMIGISRKVYDHFEFRHISYGFFESIPAGIDKGMRTLGDYVKQFKLIFTPETEAYKSLGGFGTIASIFPGIWDWQAFWNLTAFLSIILAFMNVLPIPALDGGHVLFLLYEIITGRKPGDKFMEYAQLTGMIILIALLLFANGNDIVRHFFNK